MRLLIALVLIATARAETVRVFEARSDADRASYVSGFIEKMTTDIGKTNPRLMQAIRDWFTVKPEGQPVSEGVRKFSAELSALDEVAKEGRADLGRVQIEGVIMKVVRDKFPPK
jgi:hypothetical protein